MATYEGVCHYVDRTLDVGGMEDPNAFRENAKKVAEWLLFHAEQLSHDIAQNIVENIVRPLLSFAFERGIDPTQNIENLVRSFRPELLNQISEAA